MQSNRGSWNRRRGVATLAVATWIASCGKGASSGGDALDAFRSYVEKAFTMKAGDSECDLRADVRATQGVAEPWEGLLHADIFVLEKNGKRNPFGWTVDAVFDRSGAEWTCSLTKSKSSDATMKPCETLKRFCVQDGRSPKRSESLVRPSATLYPDGWQDLPAFGDGLAEQAAKSWRCSTSKDGAGVAQKSCETCRTNLRFACATLSYTLTAQGGKAPPRSQSGTAMTLVFEPSNAIDYETSLKSLQTLSGRKPDAVTTTNEEGGVHHTACWRAGDVITVIDSGFPIAKETIVTVTAHDSRPCTASDSRHDEPPRPGSIPVDRLPSAK